jgi:hypothetical protein
MARDLVDAYRVPIAVVTGAQGGRPVAFFGPTYVQAGDSSNNYQRLMDRLDAYNLAGSVRSILFFQGESDAPNPAAWAPGFSRLLAAWNASFPNLAHVYLTQIRGCDNGAGSLDVKQAQLAFASQPKVEVMSTNGLNSHDICHFRYVNGYQQLGHWYSAVIARDSYGATGANIDAPRPTGATKSADGRTITVALANQTDAITVDAGSGADVWVRTQAGWIHATISARPGALTLTIPPGYRADQVAYFGHPFAGPWIHNAKGIGLLAFRLPV